MLCIIWPIVHTSLISDTFKGPWLLHGSVIDVSISFSFCLSTISFIYLFIFEQCFCSITNSYGWVGNLIEQCNVAISKKNESRIKIIVILIMMMTVLKAEVYLLPVFIYLVVLFLSRFSFTSIRESQDSRERGRLSI